MLRSMIAELVVDGQRRRRATQAIAGAVDQDIAVQSVLGQEVLETRRRIVGEQIELQRERLAACLLHLGRRARNPSGERATSTTAPPSRAATFAIARADAARSSDDDEPPACKLRIRPRVIPPSSRTLPGPAIARLPPWAEARLHFVGDRRSGSLEPLQRPRDIGPVHDPVVVEDADIDRAVLADRTVVEQGGQGRERVEQLRAEARIDGQLERAEMSGPAAGRCSAPATSAAI